VTPARILIITDEQDALLTLQQALSGACACAASTADSKESALQCFSPHVYDLVFMDVRASGPDPLHFLKDLLAMHSDPTILLFGVETGENLATEALETGAYDLLEMPLTPLSLGPAIRRALERCLLIREKQKLSQDCHCHKIFSRIAGQSSAMKDVLDAILMIAPTEDPVLITGESGTGKELAARTLHQRSPRAKEPFIRVHCPSIGENLLENEIFGESTDNRQDFSPKKEGFLAAAQGGTLFLDEIGDLALSVQKRLSNLLTSAPPHPGVRILASTRRNLKKKVEDQHFDENFYQAMAKRHIHLPPLRERPEDIPPLAQALLEKNCHKLKKHGKHIAPDLMKRLVAHPWEGNIRELENTLIQGILFSNTLEIGPDDVHLSGPKPLGPCSAALNQANYKDAKEEALKGFNHVYIARLLKRNRGNVSRAAKACGLERQALQQIMRRYEISPAPYRPQTGCGGGYSE